MSEIGSEFWIDKNKINQINEWTIPNWLKKFSNLLLTFSGRTAIEIIINDITTKKRNFSVALPSYCCASVIEPFKKNNIKIIYYDVNYVGGKIQMDMEYAMNADVIYYCHYFMYNLNFPTKKFTEFQHKDGIIIEDITHALFSKPEDSFVSDYYVCSLRKWGGLISGGFCSGTFLKNIRLDNPETSYIVDKIEAMQYKFEYMQGKKLDKTIYLEKFLKTNAMINKIYSNKKMDIYSNTILNGWDIDLIKKKRNENAQILYEGVSQMSQVEILKTYVPGVCPLFFAVMMSFEKREYIRTKLIRNNIFCPIHWPRPNKNCVSNIYDMELSLVCDQRYGINDMKKILKVIEEG